MTAFYNEIDPFKAEVLREAINAGAIAPGDVDERSIANIEPGIQASHFAPGVDPDGSTRTRLDQLPRQAQLAGSGQTAIGGTEETASSGQLDPAYSRWLMGAPLEWDAFACTAMRSLSRKRKPSSKRTSQPKAAAK